MEPLSCSLELHFQEPNKNYKTKTCFFGSSEVLHVLPFLNNKSNGFGTWTCWVPRSCPFHWAINWSPIYSTCSSTNPGSIFNCITKKRLSYHQNMVGLSSLCLLVWLYRLTHQSSPIAGLSVPTAGWSNPSRLLVSYILYSYIPSSSHHMSSSHFIYCLHPEEKNATRMFQYDLIQCEAPQL